MRWPLAIIATVVAAAFAVVATTDLSDATPSVPSDQGAQLYTLHCSSCHGVDARGIEGKGPQLRTEGEAAVDFVLRTGRMPLADPQAHPKRGPVRFTEAEIRSLVAYVGGLGEGPAIPSVDPARGDVTRGSQIFQLNCAACHVSSGAGAPIGGGRDAPALMQASPTQVAEALVVGPGAMPRFDTFSQRDVDDVSAYVQHLQGDHPTNVWSLGGVGPVAEGLAAWLFALLPIVAVTRWMGSSAPGRDLHAHIIEDDDD